jgi:hypothetical protein
MVIIGCDFHPSWQQVSWLDTETGEMEERKSVQVSGDAERLNPVSRWSVIVGRVPRLSLLVMESTREIDVVLLDLGLGPGERRAIFEGLPNRQIAGRLQNSWPRLASAREASWSEWLWSNTAINFGTSSRLASQALEKCQVYRPVNAFY